MADRRMTAIEGNVVDLWPLAQEALIHCPYKTDLSPDDLVEVVELELKRKYIPVAWQDRVEDRQIYWLVGWVMTRLRRFTFDWEKRFSQMVDPDVRKLRPFIELRVDVGCCRRAISLTGRWVRPEELAPLPLLECDSVRCSCVFLTLSRRDVERLGRQDWS